MSHFSHELSYNSEAEMFRRLRVAGLLALFLAGMSGWFYVAIFLTGSSRFISFLAVIILLVVNGVVGYRLLVNARVPSDVKAFRPYLIRIFRTFKPCVGRGVVRLEGDLPISIEVEYQTRLKDAFIVTIVHDEPMFVPWKFLVKRDAIYSYDETPDPMDVMPLLYSMIIHPTHIGQDDLDAFSALFHSVEVPEFTAQQSAARGLRAE